MKKESIFFERKQNSNQYQLNVHKAKKKKKHRFENWKITNEQAEMELDQIYSIKYLMGTYFDGN